MTGVSTELLPCAHCGSPGKMLRNGFATCSNNKCFMSDIFPAPAGWNRRTPSPDTPVATGDDVERDLAIVERVLNAAVGLGRGTDWNNGTHAKEHGYRQQLLDALLPALEAMARLQDRAAIATLSPNGVSQSAVARMREALAPFAAMADYLDDTAKRRDAIYCGGSPGLRCEVTQADYHRARAALATMKQENSRESR